jgi:hypothetical protein
MAPKQSIAGSTPISVLKRRIAGERAWRVEIEGVIAGYKLMIVKLRAMRNLHPTDAPLQGLVAETLESIVEALITLHELYNYSDGKGDTNGQHEADLGGTGR